MILLNLKSKNIIPILSEKSVYISHDALTLGVEAMHLGAGRKTKEDNIDMLRYYA